MSQEDDLELFRRAMRDVKRLNVRSPVVSARKPLPQARFRRADEQAVLKESLILTEEAALLGTGEEIGFRRSHVPESVLVKLRRGHFTIGAEIDLHGLTAAQAKDALREFIAEAMSRRLRCVRVIHGKGHRSGPRGPVLKPTVVHWLQRCNDVLALGSARAVDGGSGALYVLLRGG